MKSAAAMAKVRYFIFLPTVFPAKVHAGTAAIEIEVDSKVIEEYGMSGNCKARLARAGFTKRAACPRVNSAKIPKNFEELLVLFFIYETSF